MLIEASVVDLHTNGEPFRILLKSSPTIQFPDGANIVDKRRHMLNHYDIIRKVLMREPRGHADMYGCILTEADPLEKRGDFAVLFLHHSGYSLMCGHGTIALARLAVDLGMVKKMEPETRVAIQCPCGVVEAFAAVREGETTGQVRFLSPIGYLHAKDLQVTFAGKAVTFDLAYGGTFYAIIAANDIGLDLDRDRAEKVVSTGMAFKRLVAAEHKIVINDPNAPTDYLFLYGLIIVDDRKPQSIGNCLRHVILFAEGQIDRSPCGSGTTARLAALATRGLLEAGREVAFNNPLTGEGSVFHGKILETDLKQAAMGTTFIDIANGVQSEIRGRTFYSGTCEFKVEDADVFPEGLQIR